MADFDLMIRNGFVVLPEEVKKTDIAIRGGIIAEIGDHLSGSAIKEWDADGQYVFPGMIDVHVHFSEPGREEWEGFETGSQMMAAGGCTTYFDMPLNGIPSTVDQEALLEKAEIGKRKSVTDFGLWGGLVPGNEGDLSALAESGVVGYKAFLSETGNKEFQASDDYTLLNGMKIIASLKKILALHAESDPITQWLKHDKEKKGLFSADDYAETRPTLAEAEAVERALLYAKLTRCSLHFVHISSEDSVKRIEQAKKEGVDVTVETCPHYLLFNHQSLVEKGAVAKCAPPLRDELEQKKLINLLLEGKFDMISSDHSPCSPHLKDPTTHNLFQAWGGISGGQFSLMSMIELALKHQIPFSKVAEWTAAGPAKRFGLSRKGKISVGLDADLAVISLNETLTVTMDNFFAKHKQSLYMGHTFPCSVTATLSQGKLIFEDGKIVEQAQKGDWIKGGLREEKIVH